MKLVLHKNKHTRKHAVTKMHYGDGITSLGNVIAIMCSKK